VCLVASRGFVVEGEEEEEAELEDEAAAKEDDLADDPWFKDDLDGSEPVLFLVSEIPRVDM
jgi:hypothetical protein